MRRDMELVRKIVFATESHQEPWGSIDLKIDGYPDEEVSYHVKLLAQAGLLEAHDLSTMGNFSWRPVSLTWKGHEFLDAARNDTVWTKTKQMVKEKGGSVPFEVLQSILTKAAASLFGVG